MKKIIFLLLIGCFFTNCKKTKLTGDNAKFIGTWTWIGGWSDGANENFKLVIVYKGKYKLYNGSDKIDYGRILDKNGYLTFISDKPFNKGYFAGGESQLTYYEKQDQIGIGNISIRDFPSSGYKRQ